MTVTLEEQIELLMHNEAAKENPETQYNDCTKHLLFLLVMLASSVVKKVSKVKK